MAWNYETVKIKDPEKDVVRIESPDDKTIDVMYRTGKVHIYEKRTQRKLGEVEVGVTAEVVIWIGADPDFFPKGSKWRDMPEYFVTHDLHCKWMQWREEAWGNPAPRIAANRVPAHIRRCKKCGGGR